MERCCCAEDFERELESAAAIVSPTRGRNSRGKSLVASSVAAFRSGWAKLFLIGFCHAIKPPAEPALLLRSLRFKVFIGIGRKGVATALGTEPVDVPFID
jgi:hypothetical protein